jgi:ubiquitin-like modifier-activating enzyme 5
MLVRMGIGRLLLYDYDTVELANMNRMFFTREQVGMKKTAAAIETLNRLNPDVLVEARDGNITRIDMYDGFKHDVENVDLVLCTVDNYSARLVVNQVCLEVGRRWLESGVSETAISGHIQNMVPGETACFEVNTAKESSEDEQGVTRNIKNLTSASVPRL